MSAEVQESGKKGKGSKQKKMTVRVDFTPMVDMNMLLITFFMLCTTLSKPQTMEISMPSNDKNITEEQQSKVKASQAITLLLAGGDKLYYYEGEPNYKDYTSLKETSYNADGLRSILLKKNSVAVREVNELKKQKADLKISEEDYTKKLSEIKSRTDSKITFNTQCYDSEQQGLNNRNHNTPFINSSQEITRQRMIIRVIVHKISWISQ